MTTIKANGGTYEVHADDAGNIAKIVWVQYSTRGEERRTVGRGTSRYKMVTEAWAAR